MSTVTGQEPRTSGGATARSPSSGANDEPRLSTLARRVTTTGAEHEQMEIENPVTAQRLAAVPRCTAEDIELAVERARSAHARWKQADWGSRRSVLLRFHDLVLDRQDEILDVIQLESGKARRHAFEEIMDAAMNARYYANSAERHLRTRRRRGAFPFLTVAWDHHHPIGVVGVVAPWNYPLTLSISDAVPAVTAGNAVVLKVDSKTPFSGLAGLALFEEAGLPPDVLQIVTGPGGELGPELIDRVDCIMFTGSTSVGRRVASQAAERLIPSSMELGGKNAMIVLEDANLYRAVEGAERAMYSNAGQLCISMERLLVHESVSEEFVSRLTRRVRQMRLGASLSYGDDMGSLISREQLEAVREHVQDAVSKGATVLAGGDARPDVGPYFHEATLLSDVSEDMTMFADETFGPVVAVSTFSSEEEAIQLANRGCYGLNFSLWTRDTKRGRWLATRLQAGTVNINEGYVAAWGSYDAPMGGMKHSGLGRRHGAPGIIKYTEQQTVAVQRVMPIAPPPFVGQRLWARLITASLRLLRRLPGIR
jgi:succinate-semialdehyde dehydrogenase / glutarate-semialdehyde dehydrogenase